MVIELKEQLQTEAIESHLKHGKKSTICASVGSGKGVIAIKRIKSYLEGNTDPSGIIFAGGREIYLSTFKRELKQWNMEDVIPLITFACSSSLHKHKDRDWKLIIIDEVHTYSEANVNFIENYKNKECEILLLTGTPISWDSELGHRMYQIAPISFKRSIDANIKNELLNDYRIYILYHSLDDEDKYISYGHKAMQTEQNKYNWLLKSYLYRQYSSKRKFPLELMRIKQFFSNLKSKEQITKILLSQIQGKTLVYAGCIEQSEQFGLPTYHSGKKKKDREVVLEGFINDEFTTCINVAGIRESANIPGLKFGILMTPGASPGNLEQIVGRFSRLVVGEIAHLIILCARNTLEAQWLRNSLIKLDVNKISKINIDQIENLYK